MEVSDLKQFEGKKIKLFCAFGEYHKFYTGYIKEFSNESIKFQDKYNNFVQIDISAIKGVEVID